MKKLIALLIAAALPLAPLALAEEVGQIEPVQAVEEAVSEEAPVELAEADIQYIEMLPEADLVEANEVDAAPDAAGDAIEDSAASAQLFFAAEGDIPIDEAHFPDPAFRQIVTERYGNQGYLPQSVRESVQRWDDDMIFNRIDHKTGEVTWNAGITSLQGIEYFPNLIVLGVSGNPTTSLDVSALKNLESLSCKYCGLTSLNVGGCEKLLGLEASYNALTSIDITGCKYLADFPNKWIKISGSKNPFCWYQKVVGPIYVEHMQMEVKEYAADLKYDKNTRIISAGASSAPAVPAAFAEVPGAAAAQVTVAASSTAASTTAAVVAEPGAKAQLDLSGAAAKSFKSSNKKVATVNKNGVVTFKKAGKVRITYKVGKKTRKVTMTVTDPTLPKSVTLAPVTTDVKKGDSVTLTATLSEGAKSGFKWKSSNKKVATVNKNGVVTFKKAGKVTITVTTTRGGKKASVKFAVSK